MIWLNCGPIHASTLLATSFLYSYYSIKYTEYRTPFRIDMNKERVFFILCMNKISLPLFWSQEPKNGSIEFNKSKSVISRTEIWFSFWLFKIGNIGGNIHFWLKHQPTQTIFRYLKWTSKVSWNSTFSFWIAWLE